MSKPLCISVCTDGSDATASQQMIIRREHFPNLVAYGDKSNRLVLAADGVMQLHLSLSLAHVGATSRQQQTMCMQAGNSQTRGRMNPWMKNIFHGLSALNGPQIKCICAMSEHLHCCQLYMAAAAATMALQA
jgi:hypothetical protein